MAVYSDRHRYIFFANPQTASKAISKTLCESLDGTRLAARVSKRGGRTVEKPHHLSYAQIVELNLMTTEELEALLKVTGVRNPYDMLVSRYLKHRERFVQEAEKYTWVQVDDKVQRSMTSASAEDFPQWLAKLYAGLADNGRTATAQDKFLDHADVIIRFERLQADFDGFVARLGVAAPIQIVSHNVTSQRVEKETSQRRHYTEFYDDASRNLVARIYAPVIERFGYRFG